MGAEVLQDKLELYRFKEREGTYFSACILKYIGSTVEIKGLSGSVDLACIREIHKYLKSKGVTRVIYNVKGREVIRDVR